MNKSSYKASPDERDTAGRLALDLMQEIGNPLEALGYLNYLAPSVTGDLDEVHKYLALAQEQIDALVRISTQSLSFATLAAAPSKIDLVDLAEAALRIHRQTIEARNIHLVKDLPADLMNECHGGRMLQAVSNIVVNALDALPDGGKLSIRLSRRLGHVHLLVVDNGHGIQTAHFERIFERSFTTRGETGIGLGLTHSKRIVEEHDGKLTFRSSVREGRRGTAFKICLRDNA